VFGHGLAVIWKLGNADLAVDDVRSIALMWEFGMVNAGLREMALWRVVLCGFGGRPRGSWAAGRGCGVFEVARFSLGSN
jgi:hypothetical protein